MIPRRQLGALLLRSLLTRYGNQSDANSRLSVFNASVVEVDLTQREVVIERQSGSETVAYDLLVGADGIHSTVRSAIKLPCCYGSSLDSQASFPAQSSGCKLCASPPRKSIVDLAG